MFVNSPPPPVNLVLQHWCKALQSLYCTIRRRFVLFVAYSRTIRRLFADYSSTIRGLFVLFVDYSHYSHYSLHYSSFINCPISYPESNGGIFILIAPLGITNDKDGRSCETASDLSTIQFRLILKGHKSLEYWCLVIHLTSV